VEVVGKSIKDLTNDLKVSKTIKKQKRDRNRKTKIRRRGKPWNECAGVVSRT